MSFSNIIRIGFCTLCVASLVQTQFHGETVKFKLSAANLPNCDLDGPSDPYVKLFASVPRGSHAHRYWSLFGKSTVKGDTLNPVWEDVFVYQYINGTNQRWRFFVLDHDNDWFNPFDDHLGRVELNVEDYLIELRRSRQNNSESGSPIKPIQMFLTQPTGGALYLTPISEESSI